MQYRRAALAVLPIAAVALAMPLVAPAPAFAAESVSVDLQEMGNTGAKGSATLTPMANGDLKISIHSTGMTPNSPHAQHLHGSAGGMDFHCPSMAQDVNHNGYISVEEGLPMYGDIFVSLTTSGDTTKASGLAVDRFPTADAKGNLAYERTIPAAQLPAGTIEHIKDLHIVQHGIDANNNGKYDIGALGESTFAKSLGVPNIPEEATDVATCGMVAGAAAGSVPAGGVNTGDGSSLAQPGPDPALIYSVGGGAVLGSLGLALYRRRKAAQA
ncbi:hypothetical protein Dvina_29595 [Dactylosporangium vinaceum]|uniref:CHRD domain-containing protein n=1 Tax=Dactylosporangium vinaceum TaxID=53362 RepID=A0ABV5ME58_9ACTN|nr:hypothetical protein [Dactylosporangium vinaceum]UAB92500.1 hypothetical protein Dvina_29595 [Dactylosporangium vinaceum]